MNRYVTRRLNADVKNPKFDRRCRYGIEARGVIPAGTFFTYREEGELDRGDRLPIFLERDAKALFGAKAEYTGSLLAEAMFKASDPCIASTAMEVMMAHDVNSHCADNVLQKLVDAGSVTLEQVAQACKAFLEEYDECDE